MLFNPIIVMTALGVAANFIFNHNLPDILEDLLNTLGLVKQTQLFTYS